MSKQNAARGHQHTVLEITLTPEQRAIVATLDQERIHGDVAGFTRDERAQRGFHTSILDLPGRPEPARTRTLVDLRRWKPLSHRRSLSRREMRHRVRSAHLG